MFVSGGPGRQNGGAAPCGGGHNWGEMRRYDLTINSSTVGVEGAVDLIADMVRHREAQHV